MSENRWVCTVCGYVHQGEAPPDSCPVCAAGPELFEPEETTPEAAPTEPKGEYLAEWERAEDDFERKYARLVHLAKTGESEISPMRTQRTFPEWDTILFKGAQLARMPLNEDVPVSTKTQNDFVLSAGLVIRLSGV